MTSNEPYDDRVSLRSHIGSGVDLGENSPWRRPTSLYTLPIWSPTAICPTARLYDGLTQKRIHLCDVCDVAHTLGTLSDRQRRVPKPKEIANCTNGANARRHRARGVTAGRMNPMTTPFANIFIQGTGRAPMVDVNEILKNFLGTTRRRRQQARSDRHRRNGWHHRHHLVTCSRMNPISTVRRSFFSGSTTYVIAFSPPLAPTRPHSTLYRSGDINRSAFV